MKYKPVALQRHHARVGAKPCMLCGGPVQVAHAHGDSLRERDPRFLKGKGEKKPWMHWLVLPLCPPHHWLMDNRPADFVACYGTPAALLDKLGEEMGLDLWSLALAEMKPTVPCS